jgi:hypothetical protein
MSTLKNKLRRLNDLMGQARVYRSVPAQLWDLIVHKLKLGVHPRDYYDLEFFKDGKSWEEKRRYICRRGSTFWPFANNPLRYNLLFINKYVEKAVLTGLGIPTPKLLAAIGNCYEIQTKEDLKAFFDRTEEDVVIKPISGKGGHNVLVLKKMDQGYLSGNQPYSLDDIWEHINKDYERGLIVEERVIGVGHAQAMHPPSLNTFRVCTIRTNDMKWHAHTLLKVGRGGAVVDNVGATGITMYFDDELRSIYAHDFLQGSGITHHPDTGVALTDVIVEGCQEVVAAGLSASRKLGFMGTIGWDIAYTEQGPLVLEGNLWWNCNAIQLYSGPMITEELAEGLSVHKPFTKWDHRNMYPGFMQDIREKTAKNNRKYR